MLTGRLPLDVHGRFSPRQREHFAEPGPQAVRSFRLLGYALSVLFDAAVKGVDPRVFGPVSIFTGVPSAEVKGGRAGKGDLDRYALMHRAGNAAMQDFGIL